MKDKIFGILIIIVGMFMIYSALSKRRIEREDHQNDSYSNGQNIRAIIFGFFIIFLGIFKLIF
ncbi:hypothetical protein CMT42_12885 [Elizabethkingia anophelis]|nr:hypothetical protein [Elizabethkingia anophelis]AQX49489.1 hypothetical protein AYC66_01820 [Elizabethkingia anophelis]AQX87835.1 hypothetical protein AYC67_01820 [Elizabethkingia anophelis]ASV80377.1 hypothetical protein A6J37_18195 [Elizabethkingia anophelis]EHM7982519.1 hypothetical protein [Elizabethkingia anophelis]EHZ9536376.1 hypothetical protein [Elizabethkingia anophelis]